MEDDDQQGLAHFTEHMCFNGSKNFKKNDLVSFLQSIGVEFGADLNAYTGFDETVYILPIPTDKKENLDKGLLVLEDWASAVTFENVGPPIIGSVAECYDSFSIAIQSGEVKIDVSI